MPSMSFWRVHAPKTLDTIPDSKAKHMHLASLVAHVKLRQEKEEFSAKLLHQIEQPKLLAESLASIGSICQSSNNTLAIDAVLELNSTIAAQSLTPLSAFWTMRFDANSWLFAYHGSPLRGCLGKHGSIICGAAEPPHQKAAPRNRHPPAHRQFQSCSSWHPRRR